MDRGLSRDEGLVLRTLSLGETSKIVSVLTRRFGRVKLVAKGSRTLRSRVGPLLEPGNQLDLVFYAREDRELWMLKEASLRRAALTGGTTLPKLSHLFAALELADRLLPEREAAEEFEEICAAFLDRWHRAGDREMAALFFALELRWLSVAGLGIRVDGCANCDRELGAEGSGRASFRVAEGVLECAECGREGGRWLEESVLGDLRVLDHLLARNEEAPGFELSDEARRSIGRLLHEHLVFHLPRYRLPQSLYWLAAATGATDEAQR